jgi:hypothetical protein
MLPTASDVHIDTALSSFAMQYRNSEYIATEVLSRRSVSKKSDYYFKFQKGAWFRDEAALRAPGARSRGGGYPLSADAYTCREWAFHDDVPDEVRDNADAPLRPDQDAVMFCLNKVLLRLERLVAGLTLTAANWAAGHTQDAEGGWTAGSGSTFVADMEYGIDYVLSATGYRPNVLVIDHTTYAKLRQDDDLIEKIKYSQKGIVTADLIAAAFDLDRVFIGQAVYSDAEETAAGDDFHAVKIWETNAGKGSGALLYAPRLVGPKQPTAGVLFRWLRPAMDGLLAQAPSEAMPVGVRKWREESIHSDRIEAFMDVDAKLTGNDLGFLFYDTHAT